MATEKDRLLAQAMMEELGIHRLDTLPMDDGTRGTREGRTGRELDGAYGRRSGATQTTIARGGAPRAPREVSELAKKWLDAIEEGVFDDEDAKAVQGLDDLGGGRSYDIRASTAAPAEEVAFRPRPEKRRPVPSREIPPSRGYGKRHTPYSPLGILHRGNEPVNTQHISATIAQSRLAAKTGGAARNKTPIPSSNSIAASESQSRTNGPQFIVNGEVSTAQGSPKYQTDPDSVRFTSDVQVHERCPPSQISGRVYLAPAPDPDKGFFTLCVAKIKCFQWSVSAWVNTMHTDTHVMLLFEDAKGMQKSHSLEFPDRRSLKTFHELIGALREGTFEAKPTPLPGPGTVPSLPGSDQAKSGIVDSIAKGREPPAVPKAAPLLPNINQLKAGTANGVANGKHASSAALAAEPLPSLPNKTQSLQAPTDEKRQVGASTVTDGGTIATRARKAMPVGLAPEPTEPVKPTSAPWASPEVEKGEQSRESDVGYLIDLSVPEYDEGSPCPGMDTVESASAMDLADLSIHYSNSVTTLVADLLENDSMRNFVVSATEEVSRIFASSTLVTGPRAANGVHRSIVEVFLKGNRTFAGLSETEREEVISEYTRVVFPAKRERAQYSREEILGLRSAAIPPPPFLRELRYLPPLDDDWETARGTTGQTNLGDAEKAPVRNTEKAPKALTEKQPSGISERQTCGLAERQAGTVAKNWAEWISSNKADSIMPQGAPSSIPVMAVPTTSEDVSSKDPTSANKKDTPTPTVNVARDDVGQENTSTGTEEAPASDLDAAREVIGQENVLFTSKQPIAKGGLGFSRWRAAVPDVPVENEGKFTGVFPKGSALNDLATLKSPGGQIPFAPGPMVVTGSAADLVDIQFPSNYSDRDGVQRLQRSATNTSESRNNTSTSLANGKVDDYQSAEDFLSGLGGSICNQPVSHSTTTQIRRGLAQSRHNI